MAPIVAATIAALLASGLAMEPPLLAAAPASAAAAADPAPVAEPEAVLVFGEVVAFSDGTLTIELPPPQSDTQPDGSVVESRVMLPGLDDVSGQLLDVTVTSETTYELMVAEIALVEPGSPLLVAGLLTGTVLVADFVVDTRSPAFDPQALDSGTADEPSLGPDVAAAPLWTLEPEAGSEPPTLPPCTETGPSPVPCRADFAGELGIDVSWRSPDWNQTFAHLGFLKASFDSLELMYKFGGDYDFRFAIDAVADPVLEVGRDGTVQVSVDPLPAPPTYETYDVGLYVGADLNFSFCAWLIWKWDWKCTGYEHHVGFGFRNEATGEPPMAGETLDTDPLSCLGVDMLDFLPRSVIGVGTAGIELCLQITIKGADLRFNARAAGGPPTAISYPGGPVAVTPADRTVPMSLSGFSYVPKVDVDFSLDVYLFGWRTSLATIGFTDAEFRAVPTYSDVCPIMDLFPLNFLVMFTTGCGPQIESIPFLLPARGGKLEVGLTETGSAAPGRTYTVAVDGPGDADATFDLAHGQTWTSPWLPIGEYTVTEVDPPAGLSIAPSSTVTLADGAMVPVSVVNDYPAGKLALSLDETGSAAPGRTYTLRVDGPGDHDETVQLADGQTWTSPWLPLGAYTVTEVDPPDGVTYTPAATVALTTDGATVAVAVTNRYGDTEVLGETVLPGAIPRTAAIPRTGAGLALLGLGLMLVGLGSFLLVTARLPGVLRWRQLRHPRRAHRAHAI